MAYLLTESLSDLVIVYLITKRLTTPYEEWDAFKVGVIDRDGNKVKEPMSSAEKSAWTILDVMVWNMKRILGKYVNQSALARYFTAAMLLKDHWAPYVYQNALNEAPLPKELESLNTEKQLTVLRVVRQFDVRPITESRELEEIDTYEWNAIVTGVEKHLDDLIEVFGGEYERG